MKLTTNQVFAKLNTTDFSQLQPPTTNKGGRGQFLETILGIDNGSDLNDMIDGELKTFTLGQTIAVTMVNHCLTDIIDNSVEFDESKVGQKLLQTIYVGFSKGNEYLGNKLVNEELNPVHYQQLAEDYSYISAQIKRCYNTGEQLSTITGPNNLLQIRTKASKNKVDNYTPLCYNGVTLKDKSMAFYLLSGFGKEVLN
jgi:hypothetical protein